MKIRARKFEKRLWGGFSSDALADLTAMESDKEKPRRGAKAAYALARWFASKGEFQAALVHIVKMRELDSAIARDRRQHLLEALLLCRLGRAIEARTLLESVTQREPFDPSAALVLANTWNRAVVGSDDDADDDKVLHNLNGVFSHFVLAGLRKADRDQPLTIDNIEADQRPIDAGGADAKISIILPAYNAEDTILTALGSLARQTWQNFEVLIVDDNSSDGTADIAADFCSLDRRFRLIRRGVNAGNYVCRNQALAEATGDYVTVQDADDWSHPARLAMHMADMRFHDRLINISTWVRTTDDLCFFETRRKDLSLMGTNFSSLMFKRSMLDITRPWDHVRVTGDKEFLFRVEQILGLEPTRSFLPNCPLALGRSRETSLTRSKETDVATIFHGLRREYKEASRWWLAGLDIEAIRASGWEQKPPFVDVPPPIRPDRTVRPPLDVLFVADWNLEGGAVNSAVNMIHAARSEDLSCGIFQYRRYDLNVDRPLSHDIRNFAQKHDLDIIAPGEKVCARNVVITYPVVVNHLMDLFPEIEHDRLFVVVNQMAERDTERLDIAYDPLRVRANLRRLFGSEGQWAPISDYVRELMIADPRYPVPTKATWTPLIDIQQWCNKEPRRRGRDGKIPLLGRHGRDHYLKWPSSALDVANAYCADRRCVTRFLGGARFARRVLGRFPSNWREERFGARDPRAFLSQLDFFLHYPHESYIEEFGRAVMEAMAVGIPVILPPAFRRTFGKAAKYASPGECWSTVLDLWEDRDGWTEGAHAGQRFVMANCSYDRFASRLSEEAQPQGGV
ncbi:MAG: glycosyltransferase [Hyphomicrobiales bacterium]|nr:glycosyltransferase [Hyphomicrobiales bacterium]